MALVELVKVAKHYGKVQVLKPLDLTIPDGSFTVLVGPSGCGKSTLLRLLAGLESLSDGDILLDKQQINNFDPADRDIAMVFQSYALYPHLTVAENMAFHMQVKKVPKAEQQAKVLQAAKVLGIDHLLKRLPKDLSGGQRQRVAIARALILEPKVLILDEATSALDVTVQAQILTLLQQLQDSLGLTYLFISHDLATVRQISHSVSVLNRGQQVDSGKVEDVFALPSSDYTRQLIDAIPGRHRAA